MILLFDAANTLIHKPQLFEQFELVLSNNGHTIDLQDLKKTHALTAELITFPDKTSKDFYLHFNSKILHELGITATYSLLNQIFDACSYLPWVKFDDVSILSELPYRKAVVSNFHKGLDDILNSNFPNIFECVTISENEGIRKPNLAFFKNAMDKLNAKASEIIYIGDSIKLDLEPALQLGINAFLIDRNNYFPECAKRIQSFYEIKNLI